MTGLSICGENRNRGLAYALNQCIMKSRGKYIARMDADDISKPDRLERLYDFLENHREYAMGGLKFRIV